MNSRRPVGITLLAASFLWIGCFGTIFFPFLFIVGGPGVFWDQLTAGVTAVHPSLRSLIHFAAYPLVVIWYAFYVAYAFIGFGLWKLRDWARRAVIGLLIFSAVAAVLIAPLMGEPGLAVVVITWFAAFVAWLMWYLKRPRVRAAFGREAPMAAGQVNTELPGGMSRNRKLTTAGLLVATFAMCLSTLAVAVEGMIKNSDVYKLASSEARRSPCVAARLGSHFTPGWLTTGGIEESNTRGSANLQIPLRGAEGKASLVVSAEKENGTWSIKEMSLVQENEQHSLIPANDTRPCR